MTIRWKLNLSVLALIVVFLAAMIFSMHAVGENARQTHSYARMRELSQFTADIRTNLYQYLLESSTPSPESGAGPQLRTGHPSRRILHALDDIDIQIRLAETEKERRLWTKVRTTVAELGGEERATPGRQDAETPEPEAMHLAASTSPRAMDDSRRRELLRRAELDVRELRNYYDLSQYNSIAETAKSSVMAQAATTVACLLTVLLFLIHLGVVRRWLVSPIQVLRNSAETIGQGRLDHRVPLEGQDELAQLARSIDAMADGLARYQADLVRSRELSALGELCANVAHGLRNPLAAIRSTAQLAERQSPPTGNMQSVFRDLAHEADRMDERITRLFQLSKPLAMQARPTTFVELVRTAQAQAVALLRARRIALTIEDSTDGAAWPLDCEQLAQALAELITNAAHHSRDGSEVVVRGRTIRPEALPTEPMDASRTADRRSTAPPRPGVSAGGAFLEVQVADRGAGMPVATLAKAFDLFFTSRPEGSGMGLTLVRRIVERHSGTVTLNSRPNEGTTATLLLPGAPLSNEATPTSAVSSPRESCESTNSARHGLLPRTA